ncbi:hypothetical protein HOG98_03105 [bacterium]|jgi:hypothetical protein|nr:hypothetical protein [bacterium]
MKILNNINNGSKLHNQSSPIAATSTADAYASVGISKNSGFSHTNTMETEKAITLLNTIGLISEKFDS